MSSYGVVQDGLDSSRVVAGNDSPATTRLLRRNDKASESDGPAKPVNILLSVCSFIIANEFCERMAFYALQTSLVLFLQRELGYTAAEADAHSSWWTGACYITPLLGGWLADAKLGRYHGILVFISIYQLGLVLIAVAAQNSIQSPALFFPALYVVALGTGGIKPNVSTFGADQFNDAVEEERKQKVSYWNWFYFSINCGAFFSHTVIAYICQNVSFGLGYTIPSGAMLLAILVFIAGRKRYKRLPPSGSALDRVIRIVWQGCRRRGSGGPPVGHWLERAKSENGGSFSSDEVNDVRVTLRTLPFLISLILFWGIYQQMNTSFFNMGCQMDLSLGGGVDTPVAALSLFNTLIIVLLIPLVDRVIYPALRRRGVEPTILRRMGLGLLLSGTAMVVAGFIEVKRRGMADAGEFAGDSICFSEEDGKAMPKAVKMSVFYQAPQYLLIGASEVMTSVSALEFFNSQAPDTMKSMLAALNLLTTALGTWLTAVLIPIVNSGAEPWIAHDANEGHLDKYFWLLASLMVLNFIYFVWMARGYEYRAVNAAVASGDVDSACIQSDVHDEVIAYAGAQGRVARDPSLLAEADATLLADENALPIDQV